MPKIEKYKTGFLSHLKEKDTVKKRWVVFGAVLEGKDTDVDFFLKFYKGPDDLNVIPKKQLTIKKTEFCGANTFTKQVQKKAHFLAKANQIVECYLVLYTEKEVVVFKEKGDDHHSVDMLSEFKREFQHHLGEKLHWKVQLSEDQQLCGRHLPKGNALLYLTEFSLSLVTEDPPICLARWDLKDCMQTKARSEQLLELTIHAQGKIRLSTIDAKSIITAVQKQQDSHTACKPSLPLLPVHVSQARNGNNYSPPLPPKPSPSPRLVKNGKNQHFKGRSYENTEPVNLRQDSVGSNSSSSVPSTPPEVVRTYRTPPVPPRSYQEGKTQEETHHQPSPPVQIRCLPPPPLAELDTGKPNKPAKVPRSKGHGLEPLAIDPAKKKPIPAPRTPKSGSLDVGTDTLKFPDNPQTTCHDNGQIAGKHQDLEPVGVATPSLEMSPSPNADFMPLKGPDSIMAHELSPKHPLNILVPCLSDSLNLGQTVPVLRQKPVSPEIAMEPSHIKLVRSRSHSCEGLPQTKSFKSSSSSVSSDDEDIYGSYDEIRSIQDILEVSQNMFRKKQFGNWTRESTISLPVGPRKWSRRQSRIYESQMRVLSVRQSGIYDTSNRLSQDLYHNLFEPGLYENEPTRVKSMAPDLPPRPNPGHFTDKSATLPVSSQTSPGFRDSIYDVEYWSKEITYTLQCIYENRMPKPDTLQLAKHARQRLCFKMSYSTAAVANDWTYLAERLGMSNEDIAMVRECSTRNGLCICPAEVILRYWQTLYNRTKRQVPACTKTSLLEILKDMERHDLVELLQKEIN